MMSILIIGCWMAVTTRGQKALSTSFVSLFLLPTPLIGAAKVFCWLILSIFISSAYKLTFEGSAQNQLVAVIFLAASLFIFYLTPLSTFIGAYRDSGEMLRLRQKFNELSKQFPQEYRYHNNNWSGFSVSPANRVVVVSARRMIGGDASNQSPEVLTINFDEISEFGICAPGYDWKGILVGVGAFAAGASFTASLNDFTWQRVKGAYNTGLLFALRSGDLYIVQAPEKHLENLANVLKGTIH